jgi:tripartite-type tricarboxylate transporter receptor subunit TctC
VFEVLFSEEAAMKAQTRSRRSNTSSALGRGLLVVLGLLSAPAAWSQSGYPNRAIKMIVNFAPGGTVDATARIMAEQMTAVMGQPVVVESRTGAGGQIGIEAVMAAAPDGYTVLYTASAPLVILPSLEPVRFDPVRDLVAVSRTYSLPLVLVVPPSLGVTSFKALRERLAAEPGKHSFGSAGPGSTAQIVPAYLARLLKTSLTEVPYKGTGPAHVDLMAGRLSIMVDAIAAVGTQIKDGRMVGIAVISNQRIAGYEMPTIAEAGLPEMTQHHDWTVWGMLMAPKSTPPAVLERLNRDAVATLRDPAVQKRFAALSAASAPTSLAESTTFLEAQVKGWPNVLRTIGIATLPAK